MVKIPLNKIPQFKAFAYAKIGDITDANTTAHALDISAHVPPNCVAVILYLLRASGTGALLVYPNSHATATFPLTTAAESGAGCSIIPIINQEIKYAQSVASDDWDLYLIGYFLEGTVEK